MKVYFISRRGKTHTIYQYLLTWGWRMARHVRVMNYGSLLRRAKWRRGTYVFMDADELTANELAEMRSICDFMFGHPESFRVVNAPSQKISRLDQLQAWKDSGVNVHCGFALAGHRGESASPGPWKFPVILKSDSGHVPKVEGPLFNGQELDAAVQALRECGIKREGMLVVEFVDVCDARGRVAKYSSNFVAGRLIPRHLHFSEDWLVKKTDLLSDEILQAELDWFEENTHEEVLLQAFSDVGMEWGRVDYALDSAGRIVVWEINSNPFLVTDATMLTTGRGALAEGFVAAFDGALREQYIDKPLPGPKTIQHPFRFQGGAFDRSWRKRQGQFHWDARNVIRTLFSFWPTRLLFAIRGK